MMPDVARLAALTTLSCDAVLMLDADGGIEWSSPAITALLGYEARELEGQSGDQFVVPDDRDDWRAFVGDLQARPGASLFTRLHCVHRDGGARWMYVTGQNLLDEPAVRAMVVRLRESTARAWAAEGKPLQADELKFRTLVEDSLVSIFILQNDRLAYVNPTGAALLGYAVPELLALGSAFSLVHDQDRGFVIDQLADLGQSGKRTLHLTVRARRKDESVVQVEAIFAASEYMGQAATLVTVHRHRRPAPARGPAATGAETGSGRPAGRRHRARLQQPADEHPRQRRADAAISWTPPRRRRPR